MDEALTGTIKSKDFQKAVRLDLLNTNGELAIEQTRNRIEKKLKNKLWI